MYNDIIIIWEDFMKSTLIFLFLCDKIVLVALKIEVMNKNKSKLQ